MQRVDYTNIADLRAAADICVEESDNVTYLGFCAPNTESENSNTWSVLKIESSGVVQPIKTTFKWAEGIACFSHQFSNRANYNYPLRKF